MPLSFKSIAATSLKAVSGFVNKETSKEHANRLTRGAAELGGAMSAAAPITTRVGDENKKVQQMLKQYQMKMDSDNIRPMKSAVERSKRYDLKSSITMNDAKFAVAKMNMRQPKVELSDALIANKVVNSEQLTDLIKKIAAI